MPYRVAIDIRVNNLVAINNLLAMCTSNGELIEFSIDDEDADQSEEKQT